MMLSYIKRLAEITSQCLTHGELYCISDANDKIIAGAAACEFEIRPYQAGGWLVSLHEFGRSTVYEEYYLNTEREACIKFIELTEDEYHLSGYLSEFNKS